MSMYRLVLSFTFTLSSLILLAQQIGEYRFSHLTTEMGLSNHQINTILEDDFGFIWGRYTLRPQQV